eukprot:360802-Chlamydomonas_euryale.AAC.2
MTTGGCTRRGRVGGTSAAAQWRRSVCAAAVAAAVHGRAWASSNARLPAGVRLSAGHCCLHRSLCCSAYPRAAAPALDGDCFKSHVIATTSRRKLIETTVDRHLCLVASKMKAAPPSAATHIVLENLVHMEDWSISYKLQYWTSFSNTICLAAGGGAVFILLSTKRRCRSTVVSMSFIDMGNKAGKKTVRACNFCDANFCSVEAHQPAKSHLEVSQRRREGSGRMCQVARGYATGLRQVCATGTG